MHSVVRGFRESQGVFEVATPSQARLIVEAGAYERPGEALGPAPMELMLASLVTCAGSTVDAVLAKMRFEVAGLNVVADAARADRTPRVYTSIDLEFHVASEAAESRLLHAIEVTERTCSASVMLAQSTDLSARLVHVRRVPPAATRPLRKLVLRPHQSLDELAAEEDPSASWFGAVVAGEIVGSVSVAPESSPDVSDATNPFRLRSMATTMRGRGLGRVLLAAALDHVGSRGGDLVWCSARVPAAGFYLRAGFGEVSEPYEIEHIGPHVRMALWL
ncbi:MAG: GNAT family N-acetyltransferase [Acidimicrobiia bacterium]